MNIKYSKVPVKYSFLPAQARDKPEQVVQRFSSFAEFWSSRAVISEKPI